MSENASISGIRSLIDITPDLGRNKRSFKANEVILIEGEANDSLFLILHGEVGLRKGPISTPSQSDWMERLGEGAFLGLNSFWTREPALADSVAITSVDCIVFDRHAFDTLLETHPLIAKDMYALFADSLSQRYRSVVAMHVEISSMSVSLTKERNRLQQALQDLEATQEQLISREKLATLGELIAGIAHEINNPLAALISSADNLSNLLKSICGDPTNESLFHGGINSEYLSNEAKRQNLESVLKRVPKLRRSLARRISSLPENLRELACEQSSDEVALDIALQTFEAGKSMRSISLSTTRLEKLVKSLLNYGRASDGEWNRVNISDSLKDTISMLENRLKRYELNLSIEADLPDVRGNTSELNQVWTNLLVNAMDATPVGKRIDVEVRCLQNSVIVSIADQGEGIDPEHLESVFETNFTTKKHGGSFGLGLGLSISRKIAEKHSGTIYAENPKTEGARLIVNLPVYSEVNLSQ
ncbi:MAG: signal transduction histidine kinase [Candidatus Pelagisphaera sp.]|jgi:signal transduction histidine kinase